MISEESREIKCWFGDDGMIKSSDTEVLSQEPEDIVNLFLHAYGNIVAEKVKVNNAYGEVKRNLSNIIVESPKVLEIWDKKIEAYKPVFEKVYKKLPKRTVLKLLSEKPINKSKVLKELDKLKKNIIEADSRNEKVLGEIKDLLK